MISLILVHIEALYERMCWKIPNSSNCFIPSGKHSMHICCHLIAKTVIHIDEYSMNWSVALILQVSHHDFLLEDH